mmetsp:Transcript_24623/g.85640  ORF Transcript_24623/g.85640 Transcript_24623/m.85640 type:complete len:244 (+) Transcript_24623:1650-2381(+)
MRTAGADRERARVDCAPQCRLHLRRLVLHQEQDEARDQRALVHARRPHEGNHERVVVDGSHDGFGLGLSVGRRRREWLQRVAAPVRGRRPDDAEQRHHHDGENHRRVISVVVIAAAIAVAAVTAVPLLVAVIRVRIVAVLLLHLVAFAAGVAAAVAAIAGSAVRTARLCRVHLVRREGNIGRGCVDSVVAAAAVALHRLPGKRRRPVGGGGAKAHDDGGERLVDGSTFATHRSCRANDVGGTR